MNIVDAHTLYLLAAFIIGLIFGSFLNVCISRLPRRESVISPRSQCAVCGHRIRWFDNIPLLSWLVLRARCRDCNQSISWRYPLVELATGLWFAAILSHCLNLLALNQNLHATLEWHVHLALIGVGAATLGFLLIGLMVMDWQTHLLPNAFTLWGIVIGVILVCVHAVFLAPTEDQVVLSSNHIQLTSVGSVLDTGNVFFTGPEHLILSRLAAICGAALVLLSIRWLYQKLRHREGMGLGDVKLLAMIAAFLGFWPSVLALFCGTLLASVYAVFLLARGKVNATSRLPFGSFLAVGGLIATLYGTHIIGAYTALLR